ncbi:hypothetical protein ACVWYJ_007616 [Bradyrhizobium sp. USDA 4471]
MFDVYVNERNGPLIVLRGNPIPTGTDGSWRKKRAVRSVSERIRADLGTRGLHKRNLAARPVPRER